MVLNIVVNFLKVYVYKFLLMAARILHYLSCLQCDMWKHDNKMLHCLIHVPTVLQHIALLIDKYKEDKGIRNYVCQIIIEFFLHIIVKRSL